MLKSLIRLTHLRGHSIHSPFVYSLIRKVFMANGTAEGTMAADLMRHGLKTKYARELERLALFLETDNYFIKQHENNGLIIDFSKQGVLAATCVTGKNACDKQNEQSTVSIERRGYILFFYDPSLTRQHFIL